MGKNKNKKQAKHNTKADKQTERVERHKDRMLKSRHSKFKLYKFFTICCNNKF